jgi:hypothetical protein
VFDSDGSAIEDRESERSALGDRQTGYIAFENDL